MEIKELFNRFQTALKAKDFNSLEDIWLDLIFQTNIFSDLNELFGLLRPLYDSFPAQALLLLSILKEHFKELNDALKTLAVLKEIAKLNLIDKDLRNLRQELTDCYRRLYQNRSNLENFIRQSELLENSPIASACQFLEQCLAFDVGTYVYSDDEGLGRVVAVDFLLDRFSIEFFNGKKAFIPFASFKSTGEWKRIRPLANNDFLVLKHTSPELLKEQFKTNPLGLFHSLIQSVGKPLKAKEIKKLLADIISEEEWEWFWEKVKKAESAKRTVASRKPKAEFGIGEIVSLSNDEIVNLINERRGDFNAMKKLLKRVKEHRAQDWLEIYSKVFLTACDKRLLTLTGFELFNASSKEFLGILNQVFRNYRSYPSQFLWLVTNNFLTEFGRKSLMARVLDILATPDLRSYWQEARNCLNQPILKSALAEMTTQEVESFLRSVRNLSGLDDSEKVLLEQKVKELRPELKKDEAVTVIYSTEAGIQKRKKELVELLTVAIPESAKEVGRAREFGDLSENYEYKAAKEKQARLVAKVSRLRSELKHAKPIDFACVRTDMVSIGTKVKLSSNDETLEITILGPYDVDLATGIISYLAPLAKNLLGKKVGDIVPVGSKEYRVVAITKYNEPAKNGPQR